MKTAYLHIGTMKTGTSSIQGFLESNKAELSENYRLQYFGWPMRRKETIVDELRGVHAGKSVIISDEGLWHFGFSSKGALLDIVKYLADCSFDVKIILYLRRPDQFLEAWYLQGLKSFAGNPLFRDFVSSAFVRSAMDIKRRLDAISKIVSVENIIVRPFERSQLLNNDIVDDFFDTINLNIENLERPPNSNLTPDSNSLMMARLLTKHFSLSKTQIDSISKTVENTKSHSKGSILSNEEISSIYGSYCSEFEAVRDTYCPSLPPKIIAHWPDPIDIKKQNPSIRSMYEEIY